VISNRRHRLTTSRSRESERGSALLIVFLLAAVIAIMLYKAAPAVVFEAQRQKEQLLIDRGNEYKRGIKLFYVRNKTFPTSLDQLEKFNNVRYIRHRFKDPMTDKPEWRIIHVMGPGFMLTDSKVTPMPKNPNQSGSSATGAFNQNGANNQGEPDSNPKNTSANNAGPNNAPDGQQGAPTAEGGEVVQGSSEPQPTAAQLYGARRRPPAMPTPAPVSAEPAEGEDPQEADPNNPATTQDSLATAAQDNVATTQDDPNAGLADESIAPQPAEPGSAPGAFAPNGAATPGRQLPGMRARREGVPAGPVPFQLGASAGPGASQQGTAQPAPQQGDAPPNDNSPGAAGMNAVNSALRKSGQQNRASGTTSSMGTINAGAIAGVASTADASSIKIIDKQTNYTKWEFVYNPQKEALSGVAGAAASMMNGAAPGNQGQNTSSFGNNSGSAFNNGSNSGSAFNNGSNNGSAFNNGSSSNSGSAFNNNSGTSNNGFNSGSSFNNSDNSNSSQPAPQ
jgi:hypothetical protein